MRQSAQRRSPPFPPGPAFSALGTAATASVRSPARAWPEPTHLECCMTRLAEFVLRHRLAVVLFWVIMLPIGVVAAGQTSKRLTSTSHCPGSPAIRPRSRSWRRSATAGPTRPRSPWSRCPKGTTVDDQLAKITPVSTRSRPPCRRRGSSTTRRRRTRSSSPRTSARHTRWSIPPSSRASPTSGPT